MVRPPQQAARGNPAEPSAPAAKRRKLSTNYRQSRDTNGAGTTAQGSAGTRPAFTRADSVGCRNSEDHPSQAASGAATSAANPADNGACRATGTLSLKDGQLPSAVMSCPTQQVYKSADDSPHRKRRKAANDTSSAAARASSANSGANSNPGAASPAAVISRERVFSLQGTHPGPLTNECISARCLHYWPDTT